MSRNTPLKGASGNSLNKQKVHLRWDGKTFVLTDKDGDVQAKCDDANVLSRYALGMGAEEVITDGKAFLQWEKMSS